MLNDKKISDAFDHQENLDVIDALRGYAILLVIAVHSTPYIQELVWPAKRVLLMGVYGVQLFFLASALTLLMSWKRSKDPLNVRATKFFVRRFFRIAPLYYAAIIFYWFVGIKETGEFSMKVLSATLLFYNAWSPYLIPTVPGWMPVPGGWSISVEFCFYLIFPLLAIIVTSLQRSIIFFFMALVILIAVQIVGASLYPEISLEARSNFLYFWPLNHLVIFSLGFVLYYCVKSETVSKMISDFNITANASTLGLLGMIFLLSFYGQRKFFDWSLGLPPTHLLISIAFLFWALILLIRPSSIVVNRIIVEVGKVSFSAYVLHFAMLKFVSSILVDLWPLPRVGIFSIPYAAVLIFISVFVTWYISSKTYKYIERPFVLLGKTLIDITAGRHLRWPSKAKLF